MQQNVNTQPQNRPSFRFRFPKSRPGVLMQAVETTDEVLKLVDFPVKLKDIQTLDPSRPDVVAYSKVPGKAVVRQDTGRALGWVSDGYGLVSHGEVIKPVMAAMDGIDFEPVNVSMDAYGQRCAVKFQSKQSYDASKDGNGGDNVRLQIVATNSYDRTSAVRLLVGAFRMVCSNGLAIPHAGYEELNISLKVIHNAKRLKEIEQLPALAAKLANTFDNAMATYRGMHRTLNFDSEAVTMLLNESFGPKEGPMVLEYALRGKGQNGEQTAWALYNGATQFWSELAERTVAPVRRELTQHRANAEFLNRLLAVA